MGAGVVVGELLAVGEVGNLWGEAEKNFGGGRKSKSHVPQEARDVEHRVEGDDGCITWAKKEKAADRDARATRSITGKRRGEMAEAAFVAKAAQLGFGIAKPWGDSDPYDFIVNAGERLWRVQVKSAHRAGKDGAYSFRAHGHALRAYGPKDIDVLVAYVVPENAWYVFPVSVVQRLRSLKLFTGSQRKRSKFEKYREAWWVFGDGR